MKRMARGVLVVVLGWGLAGCWWSAPGRGPDRRAFNDLEEVITAETVATLSEAWSVTVGAFNVSDPVVSATGVFVMSNSDDFGNSRLSAINLDGTTRWEATPSCCETVSVGDVFVDDDRVAATYHNDIAEDSFTAWYSEADGTRLFPPTYGILQSLRGSMATYVDWAPTGDPALVTFVDLDDPTQRWGGALFNGTGRPAIYTVGQNRIYRGGFRGTVAAYPRTGGQATCPIHDPETPEPCPIWSTTIDPSLGASTAPVIGDGEAVIYVGTELGTVYALDATNGAILWTAAVGAAVAHPPALAYGSLFVPTADGDLVVLDAEGCGAATCPPLWTAATGSTISGQPAVAGRVVVTGSDSGAVNAYPAEGCGAASCTPLWSTTTGSRITGAPAIAHGKLFVGTLDGRLIAYAPTP